jgi:putative transcriptional regulator
MRDKYENSHYEAIHSAAQGLYKVGAINAEEMREYDEACLSISIIHENDGRQYKEKPRLDIA